MGLLTPAEATRASPRTENPFATSCTTMLRVKHRLPSGIGAILVLTAAACVPEGPPTPAAGASAKLPLTTRLAPGPADAGDQDRIDDVFEDDFERAELGPNWLALSPAWRIQSGRLCVRGAKNRGLWLNKKLPENARIEIDAVSDSPDGDIKLELWGDGKSGATGSSYSNATSYLAIFGGWKNTKHVLARLDEHGDGRLEMDVDLLADDERLRPVAPGQPYRFFIQRTDGRTLEWSIGGASYFVLRDPEPLTGPGHEHFGLNDWDAPVCFDNLRITAL